MGVKINLINYFKEHHIALEEVYRCTGVDLEKSDTLFADEYLKICSAYGLDPRQIYERSVDSM